MSDLVLVDLQPKKGCVMRQLCSILMVTFLMSLHVSLSQVSIETVPAKQDEGIGYTTYTVTPKITGNFTASVFFRASSPTLLGATFTFEPQWISYPYDTSTAMKVVAGGATPPGNHEIIVEAYNGPLLVRDTCLLTVIYSPGWQVFTTANSPIPSNEITCIALDKDDVAWIGSTGGLTRFDGSNWTTYSKENSDLPYNHVTSIAVDSSGGVWAGMQDGLVEFRGGTITTHEPRDVSTVVVDRTNTTWYSARSTLIKFGRPTSTYYTAENSEFTGSPNSIVFDKNNTLWTLGGIGSFLTTFDGTYWTNINSAGLDLDYEYSAQRMDVDNDGNVWVITYRNVVKFEGLNHKTFKRSRSNLVFPGSTSRMCFDHQGTGWFATHADTAGSEGGFGRFEAGKWWFYDMSNSGLPSNKINEIKVDTKRTVWIGTNKGLALYDGSLPPTGIPTSIEQDTVESLMPLITSVAPNPVSGVSSITLTLVAGLHARMTLHNNRGQEVLVVCDKMLDKGERIVQLDGAILPIGAYVLRLVAGDVVESFAVIVSR